MKSAEKKTVLFAILVIGFVMRIWGINFGLPFQFHQDEPIIVNHAVAYSSGDFNPHFFFIPPFVSYFLFGIYGILFVAGKILGVWVNTTDFAVKFFTDPTIFYMIGRVFVGVLPGTACVWLTYFLTKRVYSFKTAVYAVIVMALCFINVINSHYIYTDMFLVMFILLGYITLVSVFRYSTIKSYLGAGLFLGLACGVKYNGVLLVIPYVLAHFMGAKSKERGWVKALLSPKLMGCFAASLVTFFIVNPFSFLSFYEFKNALISQGGAFGATGWKHHFVYSLVEGISLPVLIVGLLGLVFIFIRQQKWGKIFLSFPLILYLVLVFKSQHFARYVLPLIPFIAIGAGYFIFEVLLPKVKNRVIISFVLIASAILLLPTSVKSIKADSLLRSEDTRVFAAQWIGENFDKGTSLACDSTIFRPALSQPYSQLEEKKEFLKSQHGLETVKGKKLEMLMSISDKNDPGYPLFFLFDEPEKQGQFLSVLPAIPYNIDLLRQKGIEYVVINGQVGSKEKPSFLEELEKEAVVVKEFSPYNDDVFRKPIDPVALTCIPIGSKDLFSRKATGPALRIYRIK